MWTINDDCVCTSVSEGISGFTERGRGDSLEIEIGGRDPWQLLPRNVFSVWIWNICPVSIEQTNTAVHCIQRRMKLNVVGDQRPIIQVSIK